MDMHFVWVAIAMGLAGSAHCLGMCGPLVLAVPGNRSRLSPFLLGRLSYHLGRSVAYASLGLVAGLVGAAGTLVVHQQGISVAAGIVVILLAAVPALGKYLHVGATRTGWPKLASGLRNQIAQRLQRNSLGAQWVTGLFNGYLPCGMVYVALAAALGTATPWQGGLFMALFGLATMPALLTLSLLRGWKGWNLYLPRWNWQPLVSLCIGILFILRGLNLGIPWVSPKASVESHVAAAVTTPTQAEPGTLPPPKVAMSCCTKPR